MLFHVGPQHVSLVTCPLSLPPTFFPYPFSSPVSPSSPRYHIQVSRVEPNWRWQGREINTKIHRKAGFGVLGSQTEKPQHPRNFRVFIMNSWIGKLGYYTQLVQGLANLSRNSLCRGSLFQPHRNGEECLCGRSLHTFSTPTHWQPAEDFSSSLSPTLHEKAFPFPINLMLWVPNLALSI